MKASVVTVSLVLVLCTLVVVTTGMAGEPPEKLLELQEQVERKDETIRELQRSRTRFRLGWQFRGRQIKVMDARIANLDRVARRGVDYPRLIAIACAALDYPCSTPQRKARCESVNFTDFYNESSGASNVFQFLRSTWRTTPFRRFWIFDPYAATLAGVWMHKHGRGGEWDCR